MGRTYEIAKRVFDLVAAVAVLALLGWLLVLIYVLVRLTSAGGGLFVQDRAGREGRVFRLVKFRTMRTSHVHDPDPAIVIDGDHASLTALGRFLRKYPRRAEAA